MGYIKVNFGVIAEDAKNLIDADGDGKTTTIITANVS
jgi:hypothetical protein